MNTAQAAKRVLFACTEVFANGGIQRFNRTLLAAIGRLDVVCDVYSLNDSRAAVEQAPPSGAASVHAFGRSKARFAVALSGALATARYDYVLIGHVHFVELITTALSLLPFRKPRTVLIAHGIDVWSGLTGARRRAVSSIHKTLCVSDYTRRMMQAQAPELEDSAFALFPNALHDSWLQYSTAAPAYSPIRPLPERFILSVARLDRVDRTKGILTVIEAMAMLDPMLHYIVAGRGDDMDFLRAAAGRHRVAQRVHFLGSVPDEELVRLYRECEAFVLPSGQEGFGIVFLEAMFFGAPVIAAREKGAVDVVRDEETGLLVEYGNVVSLAKAVERLRSDRALRERVRHKGRATVITDGEFTFRSFVRRCAAALDVTPPVTGLSHREHKVPGSVRADPP
jgi:glycosyltransferase involved in cell wall biosynthesis